MNGFGTFATFALTVLANGLWEALLLAGAVALVLRMSPSANATTRHALLITTLVAAVVLPIVTTAIAFEPHRAMPNAVPSVVSAPHHPASVAANPKAHANEPISAPQPSSNAPSSAIAAIARPHLALPRVAILVLVAVWLAGAAFFLIRLVISLIHLERLKRDALPLPIVFRERLDRWASIGKGRRDVRLCRSSEIAVPIAVGLFDAMILLPDRLIEDLVPEDLDRIVLHELAHLRRGDDWINGFERLAEALLFFNPAIRWLIRQLDLEREVACDDWVLERRGDALPYAQCLVKLVEEIAWPYQAMAAPGAFTTRRSISVRIERLLAARRDVRLRVSPAPLLAAGTVTLATCLLGAYVSPSIAEVSTVAAPQPAPASIRKYTVTQTAQRRPVAMPTTRLDAAKPGPASMVASAASPPVSMAVAAGKPAEAPVRAQTGTGTPANSMVTMNVEAQPRAHPHPHLHSNSNLHLHLHAHTVTRTETALDSAMVPAVKNGDAMVAFDNSSGGKGSDYISELENAGYAHLSVDQLIQLRGVGVTGDYIRQMEAAGFPHPSVDDLVRMRGVGLTPAYARDMRARFGNISVDDLVSMRAVGVTPDYIAELKANGVRDLSAEEVKSMRALGVDGSYIHMLAAAGYPHLSAEQLKQLRALGVDDTFIKSVAAHGFHNVDVDQLVRLKASGVL